MSIVFARGQYEDAKKRGSALAALSKIDRSLQERGEDRFPILSYATEEELEQEASRDPDDDDY